MNPQRRNLLIALGAVVGVLAVVAVVLALTGGGGSKKRVTGSGTTTTGSTAASSTTTSAPGVAPTTVPPPPGPPDGPLPSGFQPESVTFISTTTGWALGTAACSKPPCTSIARTRDGGRTWHGVPAPAAELSSSGSGVTGIRFADPLNGWVFGSSVYATHDGGTSWHSVTLGGVTAPLQVTSLETSAGVADAFVEQGQAVRGRLLRTTIGGDDWTPAGVDVDRASEGGIALHGRSGWLTVQTSQGSSVYRTTDGTTWSPLTSPCPSSEEWTPHITASSATAIASVCAGQGSAGSESKAFFVSDDAGTTWQRRADPPFANALTIFGGDVASPAPAVVVMAAASGNSTLYATFDGGNTWTTVYQESSGGLEWRDLGFTDASRGVVVIGTAGQADGSRLLMTTDGGHHWSVVPFHS